MSDGAVVILLLAVQAGIVFCGLRLAMLLTHRSYWKTAAAFALVSAVIAGVLASQTGAGFESDLPAWVFLGSFVFAEIAIGAALGIAIGLWKRHERHE